MPPHREQNSWMPSCAIWLWGWQKSSGQPLAIWALRRHRPPRGPTWAHFCVMFLLLFRLLKFGLVACPLGPSTLAPAGQSTSFLKRFNQIVSFQRLQTVYLTPESEVFAVSVIPGTLN